MYRRGVPSGGAWQEAHSPPRAQPGRAVTRRGSLDSSSALPRLSSLFSGPQGKDPTSGPRRAGKGLAVPAVAAAARRGRGGAAPPPLSPNRVTGRAARVSLRAKCGPNSQDRSRPPLTWAAPVPRDRGSGPSPRGRAATLGPHRPGPRPRTHHPAGPRGTSAPRRTPAAAGLGSARGDLAAHPSAPRRWVWRSRSCYPETEGWKTALAARPSRRGAATARNKGDKAASSRPAPLLPPAPAGPPSPRPPPRPGRKRPGSRARAPGRGGPRIPAPRGLRICRDWGTRPLSCVGQAPRR